MVFFDLNIPVDSSSQASKTQRTKLVVKAMELGYTAVAYNRTFRGLMSDRDRCSIPVLTLSSLLSLAPSLSSSVNFHRNLLGIPRTTPFRQYTRLTLCVESTAQGRALNSGNPVLKSYDLVAVRPLTQQAFDDACKIYEVNIISIDFSEKLPFRLKLPELKAAMKRGVYFEITYSDLIADVQLRRQVITNVKLLVDWTRGKNLILSSAAPAVTELRGPYDVMNLSSLFGLSMERAKAAISKNCRNLITNALRKKHFYKEAIRVEPVSSDGKSDSKESFPADWLKWDPISSGEGDLQLDDLAKSFSASTKVSKTVKAIDFASLIDSIPSQGEKLLNLSKGIETPVATVMVSEKSAGPDHVPEIDLYETQNQTSISESSQDLFLSKDAPENATEVFRSSEKVETPTNTDEELKSSEASDKLVPLTEIVGPDMQVQRCIVSCQSNVNCETCDMEIELKNTCFPDTQINASSGNVNFLASQIENCTSSQGFDVLLPPKDVMDEDMVEFGKVDEGFSFVIQNNSCTEHLQKSGINELTPVVTSNDVEVQDVLAVVNCETSEWVAMDEQENDVPGTPNTMVLDLGREQLCGLSTDKVTSMDDIPTIVTSENLDVKDVLAAANHETSVGLAMDKQKSDVPSSQKILVLEDDLKTKDDSVVAKHVSLEDERMEEQKDEEADVESSSPSLVLSGKSRAKKRTPQPLLFPFKRLLNPVTFKKKAKKFKGRMKTV